MNHKPFEQLTPEEETIWEQELAEYWTKELAKPQPMIVYLPTAQRASESLVGPLTN